MALPRAIRRYGGRCTSTKPSWFSDCRTPLGSCRLQEDEIELVATRMMTNLLPGFACETRFRVRPL